MALVLDGSAGVSGVDGTASNPSYEGTDSNTGIFFPAADTVAIGTGGTERLRVDSAGNAGLGVTPSAWSGTTSAFQNPSGALYSFSGGSQNGLNSNAFYNGSSWIYRSTAAASDYYQQTGAHIWRTAASGTAGNAITFTQAMTLDASGNLLVGSSTSAGSSIRLQIYDNSNSGQIALMRDAGGQRGTLLYGRLNSGTFQETARIGCDSDSASPNNGILYFYTSNASGTSTERARITSGGDWLVGTTTNGGVGWTFEAVGYSITKKSGTATTVHISFQNNNGEVGKISTSGSATTYGTSSDYRLKENVAPMTGALAKVAALKPCTYTWKVDGSDGEGFIAHELAEVCPQAVTGEKDGEQMQGVDYGKLTPILTAALQEAIAKIETLQARIAVLEAK